MAEMRDLLRESMKEFGELNFSALKKHALIKKSLRNKQISK